MTSKPSRSRKPKAEAPEDLAAELSYSEAQTALELALSQLQDPDLAVEAMTELYERAQRFANRCEQLLNQVEQTVQLWDLNDPAAEPQPYES